MHTNQQPDSGGWATAPPPLSNRQRTAQPAAMAGSSLLSGRACTGCTWRVGWVAERLNGLVMTSAGRAAGSPVRMQLEVAAHPSRQFKCYRLSVGHSLQLRKPGRSECPRRALRCAVCACLRRGTFSHRESALPRGPSRVARHPPCGPRKKTRSRGCVCRGDPVIIASGCLDHGRVVKVSLCPSTARSFFRDQSLFHPLRVKWIIGCFTFTHAHHHPPCL